MIRGLWHPPYPLPLVQAALRIQGLTEGWHLLNFVIDTGATHSCIHPLDALDQLRLPRTALELANWDESIPTMGIGGQALYRPLPGEYAFADDGDDALVELIEGASIRLAARTEQNQRLPSLLGWDVLRHFRLTIDSDEVWLERR